MKNLLIVEDEKMIRQGIQAMVLRSSVAPENVILCKNGEEAYEILQHQEIDVMITDIRMPKKDGITLVREVQDLPHVPKIIVISGYDDFNYAVELLRYGAKEYILKPVEREKLEDALIKLDKEINKTEKQKRDSEKIGNQQFKYLLLNSHITQSEIEIIEDEFKHYFLEEEFYIICTNYKPGQEVKQKNVICLNGIQGQTVYIVKATMKQEFISKNLNTQFVGISKTHKTIREVREAYEEALYARKKAFAVGSKQMEYSKPQMEKEVVSEEIIDQFVQMIGTNKIEETCKFIMHIVYKVKRGSIEPEHFEYIMKTMVNKIDLNYKNILSINHAEESKLKDIYCFDHAESYCDAVISWIENINERLSKEFCDYKNKQKIQSAITYIHDNFSQNLNMAVVSNHISMNYSLFSYEFKQFTGMNFVNYLKTIRINEAKRLLKDTELKIVEISQMVGYENEKNFMKSFRSLCGISPSEYRKNVQVGKGI